MALGGDAVRWHWAAVENAAAVLAGGSGRRTCNDSISVSVIIE